jgi:hypothetical protein
VYPLWLHHIVTHYVINGTVQEKKSYELEMCVLVLSTAFTKTCLILRRIQRDIVINVKTSSFKVSVILV